MEQTQKKQNDEILFEQYTQAKNAMRTGNENEIARAKDIFLGMGNYRNSSSLAEKCEMLLTFREGNTVTFGAYQGKPIRWKVVDSSGKMRMLIAEDLVLEMPYNNLRVDSYWQSTTLRKWLNKEFVQEAFTPEQRLLLIGTRRTNESNELYYTQGGLPTMDKVFIPSKRELDHYLPQTQDRALGKWWWLRTPGDNLLAVTAVEADGSVYMHGVNVNYPNGGVRPAMWLLLRDY